MTLTRWSRIGPPTMRPTFRWEAGAVSIRRLGGKDARQRLPGTGCGDRDESGLRMPPRRRTSASCGSPSVLNGDGARRCGSGGEGAVAAIAPVAPPFHLGRADGRVAEPRVVSRGPQASEGQLSKPRATVGCPAPRGRSVPSLRVRSYRGPPRRGQGRRRGRKSVPKHGISYGRHQFPWHKWRKYTH